MHTGAVAPADADAAAPTVPAGAVAPADAGTAGAAAPTVPAGAVAPADAGATGAAAPAVHAAAVAPADAGAAAPHVHAGAVAPAYAGAGTTAQANGAAAPADAATPPADASCTPPVHASTAANMVGCKLEAFTEDGCWVPALVLEMRSRKVHEVHVVHEVKVQFEEPQKTLLAGPHYFCEENETPLDVAHRFSVPGAAIMKLNKPINGWLKLDSKLPGKTLLWLPHVVAAHENETPQHICEALGIDMDDLAGANRDSHPFLALGSVLRAKTQLLLLADVTPLPVNSPCLATALEVQGPAASDSTDGGADGSGWRRAEVRRLLGSGRFRVCVEGVKDLQQYDQKELGIKWRMAPPHCTRATTWVAVGFTRPMPPPTNPLDFHKAVTGNGTVQVLHNGAWWLAAIDAASAPLAALHAAGSSTDPVVLTGERALMVILARNHGTPLCVATAQIRPNWHWIRNKDADRTGDGQWYYA